ncbi:hypothetical protein HPP92_015360 [Vanilla planifolia]|uniref:Transmembrane protein n=1 Tax=Vanilla planifolia TaxID=51239 RepID=A0A835QL17_VANPL|nr:hypothetical protein HPP92_015360 [Vanilla planifolia]
MDYENVAKQTEPFLQDNDQKNLVVVHGLRNSLVGSCLVASSAFAACVGLLSLSSSVDRVVVIEKCAALLLCFAAVFLCETILVINTLILRDCPVTEEQLAVLLRKAALLSAIGHRLFFAAMPLLLWFFGRCSSSSPVAVVVALYVADVARREKSVRTLRRISYVKNFHLLRNSTTSVLNLSDSTEEMAITPRKKT